MKKCTTCGKTFDDNLKFCQTDGTLLVEVADSAGVVEAEDPYKTIVGGLDQLPIPPKEGKSEISDAPAEAELDPMQTMIVSPEEMRKELEQVKLPDETKETPPIETPSAADVPPPFEAPPLETPSANVPPPSPFDAPSPTDENISEPANFNEPDSSPPDFGDTFEQTAQNQNPPNAAPIPSPFDESMVGYKPPPVPQQPYKEAEIAAIKAEALNTPFADEVNSGNQQVEQSDWTPPPAPDANWQNQEIGQNSAFQSPPAATGQNQTLPIISLVLGIISLCCYISPLTGLGALITGYLGMKNANNDPANYGGKSLAIAGMITGGIFFLIGLLYWIYIIFVIGFVGLSNLSNMG